MGQFERIVSFSPCNDSRRKVLAEKQNEAWESKVTHPNLPAFRSEPSLGRALASGLQIQCPFQEPTLHSLPGTRSYPLCTFLDVLVSTGCLVMTRGVIVW